MVLHLLFIYTVYPTNIRSTSTSRNAVYLLLIYTLLFVYALCLLHIMSHDIDVGLSQIVRLGLFFKPVD